MSRTLLLATLLPILVIGCSAPQLPSEKEQPEPVAEVQAVAEVTPAPESAPAEAPQLLINDGTWKTTASTEEPEHSAAMAADGSGETRWSSEFKDGQWWMVDFGREQLLASITLTWEAAHAAKYAVLVSMDGATWDTAFTDDKGGGGVKEITFAPRTARFVKLDLQQRATHYGFSLHEVAFNEAVPSEPLPMKVTSSSGDRDYAPEKAVDGDRQTRWSSNFNDDEWWMATFDEPQVVSGLKIQWETAFGEKYDVQLSDDGQTWKTVYAVPEGDGSTDIIFFKPTEARCVRIQGRQRGTGWGYSIWEVEFFAGANRPEVSASTAAEGGPADNALDGDPATAWHSAGDGEQVLTIKLPKLLDIGGVQLAWGADFAADYDIETSLDGRNWQKAREVRGGDGKRDFNYFNGRKAGYVRLRCLKSGAGNGYELADIEFKGGEERGTPLVEYKAAAKEAPRGRYPMWLLREQEFWTVTGVIADDHETLIGETGTIEPRKGDFCVMPFVLTGGKLVGWADVQLAQRLEDNYLPLPSTTWDAGAWKLDVSAIADGPVGASYTVVRYRLTNTGAEPFSGKLGLAVRPIQLNPVWQHGGLSAIQEAECVLDPKPAHLKVNKTARMISLTAPSAAGAVALGDGDIADFMARGEMPAAAASDADGRTSAGFLYDLTVPAGESRDVIVAYRLHDGSKIPEDLVATPEAGFERVWNGQRAAWEKLLGTPVIRIPEKRITDVLKSYAAYVLINRDGPWFKPGARNYNHSWMRDGALTGASMLRLGHPGLVKEFIQSFTGFVGENGWVPYIIMEDGKPCGYNPDPASGEGQEYDSQGEYAFIVRLYYDFTGDEALVREVYPSVVRAMRYIQELRRRRMTDEYKTDPEKQAYYGILPHSNSHEGYYPAKHSYWDDFWGLRGLKDAIFLAEKLGQAEDAAWMREELADFRKCTYDSIMRVIKDHDMKVIPGCVELGDIDPTSTTIAIMACDETENLPQPYGQNTFDLYFAEFSKRLKPGGEATFTPYEIRNADVFVRINQRDRALAMHRKFLQDYVRPFAWNHMAEVVHARVRAPSYIGDMPHTWVGSDFLNAVRSMFAYEKGDALVIAAGIDPAWLAEGVSVEGLPTQYGPLDYAMKSADGVVTITVGGKISVPGGILLPLPESLQKHIATVNDQPAELADGSIRFAGVPATIVLKPAATP